jgi:hypothetical protein
MQKHRGFFMRGQAAGGERFAHCPEKPYFPGATLVEMTA